MAAQISAIEQLISMHEDALVAALTIIINTPEPNPPLVGKSDGRDTHVATKVARKAKHAINVAYAPSLAVAWTRRSRAACEQIETVTVSYENSPDPENAQRGVSLHRLGTAYIDPLCRRLNDARPEVAILSSLPEAQIRKILMELPGFKSWTVAYLNGYDGVVPDDRRFEQLSAELLAQKETLSRAPHIRGLIAAEIERVRDNAQRVHALRKGRLLFLQFR